LDIKSTKIGSRALPKPTVGAHSTPADPLNWAGALPLKEERGGKRNGR